MSVDAKKPVVRRQLLIGAAAATALAAFRVPALARATGATAAGPSPVGALMTQITDRTGNKRMDIISFGKDGLVVTSGALPLVAETPAQPHRSSIGQGTWSRAAGAGSSRGSSNSMPARTARSPAPRPAPPTSRSPPTALP